MASKLFLISQRCAALLLASAALTGCVGLVEAPPVVVRGSIPAPVPQPVPVPVPQPRAVPMPHGQTMHVPPDRVPPPGTCKVWFNGLPPDRQSPPMSCGKAQADASRWGGNVIWSIGPESNRSGVVGVQRFGQHGLHGVPPDRLPPPGACRLWNDGAPPDRQASPTDCRTALAQQSGYGGRVLYMPGSDLGY